MTTTHRDSAEFRASARKVLGDGWEDIVDCPVCFSILSSPKIMTCGHSICSDCEKLIVENGRVCCPKCRKFAQITEIGLATNYTLKDLVAFCQQKVELAKVANSKYEYTCVPCQQKLVHDQALNCITCQDMCVCSLCAFTGHRNHKVIFIKDQHQQADAVAVMEESVIVLSRESSEMDEVCDGYDYYEHMTRPKLQTKYGKSSAEDINVICRIQWENSSERQRKLWWEKARKIFGEKKRQGEIEKNTEKYGLVPPRAGYLLFMRQTKEQLKIDNPEMKPVDIKILAAAEWQKLSEAQKIEWREKARKLAAENDQGDSPPQAKKAKRQLDLEK